MQGTRRALALASAMLFAGAAVVWNGAPAHADTQNWDWFGYLSEIPNKMGCESAPAPSYDAWMDALNGEAPSRDDVVFFIHAYPCSTSVLRFMETRDWKNWYLFGIGSYDPNWDGKPFTRLGTTATILYNAGFWQDGPI